MNKSLEKLLIPLEHHIRVSEVIPGEISKQIHENFPRILNEISEEIPKDSPEDYLNFFFEKSNG